MIAGDRADGHVPRVLALGISRHRQLPRQRARSHVLRSNASDETSSRSLGLTQIYRREWNIVRVPGQRVERAACDVGRLSCSGLALTKLAQQVDPALAD